MFAERIKLLRKHKNMTQIDFAKQFDIASGTIAMWELGKREPDFEMLTKIASFFDVSTDYLLGNTDEPNPKFLDKELEGIQFSLWGEIKDLTKEQKQDILDYIRFKKNQRGE